MYANSYKTARSLLGFITLVGWIVFAAGVIAVLAALGGEGLPWMILLPSGLANIVLGLILVAITQVSVAVLDQADISREMLRKMQADEEAS
jgi:hypothetical protein